MLRSWTPLLLLATFFAWVQSHSLTLQPHNRECFHEELKQGDHMVVSYQTDLGGDMLINFWLTDPNGQMVNSQPRSSMGEHAFEATIAGKYTYCFLNEGNDGMAKEMSFNVHGVVYVSGEDPDHQDPLEKQIRELSELVAQVKDEQEYILIRERVHRDTSESTNTRVKWWSIGQTVLLVAVCLFQVVYLKRFFEVKQHL